MTVKELKEMIKDLPDDMEILNDRYSDYDDVCRDEWQVVGAVNKNGYYMRSHKTMSDENKASEKQYLHLSGN